MIADRPRRIWRRLAAGLAAAGLGAATLALAPAAAAASAAFIAPFNTVQTLASTVPKNGDVNPYGVAVAPVTTGRLVAGNVLVSNFNNHRNLQGTGSTIVQISPAGPSACSHPWRRTSFPARARAASA